jgi:hypothetical protein
MAQAKFSDTLDIDHEHNVLYVGDNWSSGLDVFDLSTAEAKYVKTIGIRGRIYGVAVASDIDKVFVGLSGSRVAVIDISSGINAINPVVAQIDTGGDGHTDLLDYVPTHKALYAANRLDGFLVSIDAESHAIIGRLEGLGSGLEQPRFNPADGMLYLTNNKANVLYQIDPIACTLVSTFSIEDPCFPNGMAINPATNRALLACGNQDRPHTVIWDLAEQRIESIFEESGCGDGAIYEPTIDRFLFAAAGYATGPVMGVFGGTPVRFITNVPTTAKSSWVAYDRKNKVVYAPANEEGRPALVSFRMPDL